MIVCGLHRSGTTYTGELLKGAGVTVVHEPLNQLFGMTGVPVSYPHVQSPDSALKELIDDAVFMRRSWNKDTASIQAKGVKKIIYRITGGKSGLRWGWLRMRKWIGFPVQSICLKDPFLSLATPWLVEHHGLKSLCLVRHPAAIHYSTEKQNWRFDVGNLRRQEDLIERYGQGITQGQWAMAEQHAAASIAVLWKLMWRINSRLAARDERLKIITHESLCMQPVESARSICAHFDIPFTSELEAFVREHSGGDRAEAEQGRTHDFKRDSKAIPDSWRGKLSGDDEEMIADIAGAEIMEVYGRL
jgi:hypothetical protein